MTDCIRTVKSNMFLMALFIQHDYGIRTVSHRSTLRVFSGAGQPQILRGLGGASYQPLVVWLRQGARERVWRCCLNPQPAAAAAAAGARP